MSATAIIRGTCSGADLKTTMAKIEDAHAKVTGAVMFMKNTDMGWQVDYVVTAELTAGIQGRTGHLIVLDEVA